MNPDLIDFIQADTPKINPDIAEGLITKHIQYGEAYLDDIFRAVLKDLDHGMGFKYLGFERMSPADEFIETTKGKNNGPRQYNLARTDTYMVKLKFEFDNEIIEKPLSLPFISQAGTLKVFGTTYAVTPVLADRIISITPPVIFIRLMSVRLNFEKLNYYFMADNRLEYPPVVVSEVYKTNGDAKTPMVFYLLCKYGVKGMFKHYFDADVIYDYDDQLTRDKYPEKDYVICKTAGISPKRTRIRDYEKTKIGFAVPRNKFTPTMKAVISGLYYILDLYPNEIAMEDFEDQYTWRVRLGYYLFGYGQNPEKLNDDILNHLSSVDQYIDEVMRVKFKKINMDIRDMYQLFFVIIDQFENWEAQNLNQESNLYPKELSILYYLYQDLTKQIVNLVYQLKKKNKFNEIKINDVKEAIRAKVKTNKINIINKTHGEVNVVNYSGDNMIFGVTHLLVPQDKTTKLRNGNDGINLEDPTKRLHVSTAEVRTYSGMAKAAPDGSTRLNPHLKIDHEGGIIRDESLREMLDKVQSRITRK